MSLNRVRILWFSKQRNLWMVERRDGRDISRDYLNETEIGEIFEELMVVSGLNVEKQVLSDCIIAIDLIFRLERLR